MTAAPTPDPAEETPPEDTPPGVRAVLQKLAEDARAYARAELDYAKADLINRAAHIGPALIRYAIAAVLALGLVVAAIVAITLWVGQAFGFGWALAGAAIVLGLAIWLIVRAAARHLAEVIRPWQKP